MTINFTIHQIEFTIHKVQKFHIQYISAIIVTASSAYCGLYLCVLGLCLEDGVMMLTSTLFIGIAYFFPKIAKISESVYTKKITDKVYNFFYSEEI